MRDVGKMSDTANSTLNDDHGAAEATYMRRRAFDGRFCAAFLADGSSTLKCTKCQAGYFLHLHQCLTQCSSGFIPSIGTYKCFPNIFDERCVACTDDGTQCAKCADLLLPFEYACVACSGPPYAPTDDRSQCGKCNRHGHCLTCDNKNSFLCSKCQYPYALVNGECTTCWPGALIEDTQQCGKCLDYKPNCDKCSIKDPDNKCASCTLGYYLNKDGDCIECRKDILNCQICTFDQQTQRVKCLYCAEGYYSDPAKCSLCAKGCGTCLEATKCDSCAVGYFQHNYTCLPCNGECVSCVKTKIQTDTPHHFQPIVYPACVKCKQGYVLESYMCVYAGCNDLFPGCHKCRGNYPDIHCQDTNTVYQFAAAALALLMLTTVIGFLIIRCPYGCVNWQRREKPYRPVGRDLGFRTSQPEFLGI